MLILLLLLYIPTPTSTDKTGTAVVVAAIMLIALAFLFFGILKDGTGLIRRWLLMTGLVKPGDNAREKTSTLLTSFTYFQKLSPSGKKIFLDKVLLFLNTKTFEGAGEYEPDSKTITNVAAAAAQISYGLPDFTFPRFETIRLFPTVFRLRRDAPLMKGGTNPQGCIYMSVKDFEAGYANPHDRLNVGLHELAHALFIELLDAAGEEIPHHILPDIRQYIVAADRILSAGAERDDFLRDYAFTNRHEFFAVCVEHFFESPVEFKRQLPDLYRIMTDLLNQDPSNVGGDYSVIRR